MVVVLLHRLHHPHPPPPPLLLVLLVLRRHSPDGTVPPTPMSHAWNCGCTFGDPAAAMPPTTQSRTT
jgi:hypothetical protein